MANKANVLFDKTEIIVQISAKQAMSIPIRAEDIISISFHPFQEKKLFKTVESEIIVIKPKKFPMPMTISKLMVESNKKASSWDSIKTQMEKFAKDNKISLAHESDYYEIPKFDMGM